MIYKVIGLILAMIAFIALMDPDVIRLPRFAITALLAATFIAITFLTVSIFIEVAS